MYPRFYPSEFSYHIVGRYKNGRYYARPDREVIDAFLFIIGCTAKRYEIGIAAWAMMGSHPHVDVFDLDPTGPSRVALFKQTANSCFAKWLNWFRGSRGSVIDPNVTTQQIAVVDVGAERNTVAYIETNMLDACILDEDGVFDGATSKRDYLLESLRVERPEGWFQKRTWPDEVEIQLDVPPLAAAAGYTREKWWARTSIDVYAAKMSVYEEKLQEGLKLSDFLTPAQVLTESPLKDRKKKVNFATVRCTGTDRSALAGFFRRDSRHRRLHGRRMDQIREGNRDVEFPYGTCRMVLSHGYGMRAKPG